MTSLQDLGDGNVSDVSVSSVHTSDLSDFDDESRSEKRDSDVSDDATARSTQSSDNDDVTDAKQDAATAVAAASAASDVTSALDSDWTETSSPTKQARKLISLQYNLSDSEDDEQKDERRKRIVRTSHVAFVTVNDRTQEVRFVFVLFRRRSGRRGRCDVSSVERRLSQNA